MADEKPTTQAADPPAASAAEAPAPPAEAAPKQYIWGTGRRKKSVARVRIRSGSGKFLVNKRQLEEYFKSPRDQATARSPLELAKLTGQYDIWVNISGGGSTGQADAIMLGLARALAKVLPDVDAALRGHGLLTRDARAKERKKYGRHGARRGLQWAKR